MRNKFSFLLLIPTLLSVTGCSPSHKISFVSDSFTFDTYYDDSYFLLDNKEVHEEIALASHAMALATFRGGEDYENHSENLKNLWQKEGFSKIYMNDAFYIKPQTDSIAFGIASKVINDFALVAIAVRGGNYDAEWASNFTIGLEGNATGFNQASDAVVKGFDDYVKGNNLTGHLKIWISGYSRAAITSNMAAGKLINRTNANQLPDSYTYSINDIYAYCFEPPMGVEATLEEARAPIYQGIHNFLNYNDFVPLVAPYEWGFTRYGTDHYYPDRTNDIYFDETERKKILSLYHFTYGANKFAEYTVDKWKFFDVGEAKAALDNLPRKSLNPSQGRFSRNLISSVAVDGFYDRETYYSYLENGLRQLLAAAFGANEKIGKLNGNALVDIIFEYTFIKDLFLELENNESEEFAVDMQLLFLQIFGANDQTFEEVMNIYVNNFNFFTLLPKSFKTRKDVLAQLLYRDNMMGIAIGHMPELSYSLLCACDSRFMGDNKCKLNDGSYYILHLDNPKNFTLIEKNLKKEVFAYKDGEMISNCLSAEQFANGSIDVYLPKNGEYEYIVNSDGITLTNVDPVTGIGKEQIHLGVGNGTILKRGE